MSTKAANREPLLHRAPFTHVLQIFPGGSSPRSPNLSWTQSSKIFGGAHLLLQPVLHNFLERTDIASSTMPKTPPAKKVWSRGYYQSRKLQQLEAQKAAYAADPEKFSLRRHNNYVKHSAQRAAYQKYYRAFRRRSKQKEPPKQLEESPKKHEGISFGMSCLISAAAALLGSSSPSETSAILPDVQPELDVKCDETKPSSPAVPPHRSAPESPSKLKSTFSRKQCLDPKTGALCPWRPHSQHGTEFGCNMFPRNEGHYSFSCTEYKYWLSKESGHYEEKSGNTFICRLCRQKSVGETSLESGHAAFCTKNSEGGMNKMGRIMEANRKINNRPPVRDSHLHPKRKSPPNLFFQSVQPKRQKVYSAPRTSPRLLLPVSTRKSWHIMSLRAPKNPNQPARTPSASKNPNQRARSPNASTFPNQRASKNPNKRAHTPTATKHPNKRARTLPKNPKNAAGARKQSSKPLPAVVPKSSPRNPKKAKSNPDKYATFAVVRRPPRCFGKHRTFAETLRIFSDKDDYSRVCTPDGQNLRDDYQIFKDGQPLYLERSAKFLGNLRSARLKHTVSESSMDNKTFEAKYSKCVHDAITAAKLGKGLPLGQASQFEPIATWRSQRTKAGNLTRRAEKFQKQALDDLTMATKVRKLSEKKLGFTAHRANWRQWLHTQFQITIASIASTRSRDSRLIEVCKVMRYFGFFHIAFVSDPLNIGIMQDLAWLVGCKWQ